MKNAPIYSVTQVNQYIKGLLDRDGALAGLFVRGELSNYKAYPSGHHYFSLKDAEGAIRCVMFRREAMGLRFRPENGMKVVAFGRVTVFPRDGQYQLYCSELTPDGVGDLHVAFEQLKQKLYQEGLFDPAHKKPIPRYPRKIALITSPAGAAVRDMLRRGEDPSEFLPAASAEILKREKDAGRLCIKPLDEAVSAFLRLSCREMRGKMEVSGGIENRLHEAAKKRRDIEGILDLAAERRYSRSRLRRAIFGSMLGYTMADLAETPLYTSLLAANEVGRGMVSGITIPAISRPSDYKKLPRDTREQFERAVRADYLQVM